MWVSVVFNKKPNDLLRYLMTELVFVKGNRRFLHSGILSSANNLCVVSLTLLNIDYVYTLLLAYHVLINGS